MRTIRIAAIAVVIAIWAISTLPAVASAQFTETKKGTGVGRFARALGTGAIVGAAVHHPVAGTFIGAGIGGVGGYAVGHELQQQQNMNYENRRGLIYSQQRQIERQRRREIQQLQQEQSHGIRPERRRPRMRQTINLEHRGLPLWLRSSSFAWMLGSTIEHA